jgi:hypothetical protein
MFNLCIPNQFCNRVRQDSGGQTGWIARSLTIWADLHPLWLHLPLSIERHKARKISNLRAAIRLHARCAM